jgi:hypothetical protein
MPVPSLVNLCARVLAQSNVQFADPNSSVASLVTALSNALQNLESDQYSTVELHGEIMAFYREMNEHAETIEKETDRFLQTAVTLGQKVAARLAAMDPMVQWLGTVNDEEFARIHKAYQGMSAWLLEIQAELILTFNTLNDLALTPQ